MSTTTYPVRVDASPEPGLSRWLWLVKWFLIIPHYVVLAFLWLAFAVLSIVAFFAIAFTGRYPRGIFDFNVGVLRWSWRVAYYAYGALATDRYPPFTLADVPEYPAHLEIAYPERLSRGLVLVKWWLLALPHYAVVGIFVGGSVYVANEATSGEQAPWMWGGGLIGVLVLVAGVVLLFTGRYPSSIFDLVLGLNRWVLRVAAYAGLMTDDYPPFRLDMGGADPGSPVTITSYVASSRAPAPVRPAPAIPPAPASTWSAGRVVTMVLGCLTLAAAGGLLAGGATLAVLQGTFQDDDGFYMSADEELTTATYALSSVNLETKIDDGAGFIPDRLLGETRVRVAALDGAPVFVGIGPTDEVRAYLADVGHTVVVDFDAADTGGTPVYEDSSGGAPGTAPAEALRWSAQSAGSGTQDLVWSVDDGDWTVVVMNADGSANVAVDVSVGAELPAMWWVVAALSILGACLLLLSAVLIRGALRVTASETP
ncbi:DUF4389 domain-containing protein [Nocardioides zhouii]|uniref:DUF4389 domain-containing protein n=1 Tax=Nocardioides zhouii TaxID=1168729 RepID=A0A4Q2T505_9ACTN|nr:DUF4389 domain-containing protein [Nocardioides zhouii]RYC13866.1 DUF4389 domain-containing protein [Nocardioides zhouii]